jgi:phage-related protein
MLDKPLIWLGSSRLAVRAFPKHARQEMGFQLWRVQRGLTPTDWRPMSSVGAGVMEIRVHSGGEFRLFYVAKFADAVYVLHAFQKKTAKAAQRDTAVAQRRYSELQRLRKKEKGT